MTDLAVYDQKIGEITKKITTCESSMAEFNAAVAEFIALSKRYETAYNLWRAVDKAYTDWVAARDQFVRSNLVLPSNMVWDGLKRVDCNTVGTIDYRGLFGESYGMKNCNDVPGTVQAKCTACGFPRCACTAGLDSWCGTSKCTSYRTIDAGTFLTTQYYRDWLAQNPQPPTAGPAPQPPPPFSPSVNMVCTQCTQTIDLSGITSAAGAVQLQLGANTQSQNCIASLNQEKAALELQKAEAARKLADEQTAAAAALAAQQSAAAAVTPKTQEELAQTHAAAVGAERANIIWSSPRTYLIIILVIFVVVAAIIVGYFAATSSVV